RRQLLEEAAQVRGVKARRQEAVQKLQELAANMLRLEDLKTELGPRLEALRAQAAAAREAAEANARLELLRGSIVWEEWREARDAHRRVSTQVQSLERRLIEAREQSRVTEEEFQSGRTAMQAAQDRRLARQRTVGQLRLELSDAEHRLQLAEERLENRKSVAETARRAEAESKAVLEAAADLHAQLTKELALEALPVEEVAETELAEAERRAKVAEAAAVALARLRFVLGGVVGARDGTVEGVYREPGMVRSGADPRAALEARRAELQRRIPKLEVDAGLASDTASELRRLREAMERGQMRNRLDSIRRQ